MKKITAVILVSALAASGASADFWSELKEAVQEVAKETIEEIVVETTSDLIREMVVGYSSEKTKSEEEVAEDYEKENGSLPRAAILSSYRTEMLPGPAVSAGTPVHVKSYIEIIPGTDGKKASIEERLTIYDNEDHSLVLKSLTKKAGERSDRGGEFYSEFSFALPEGLPQGLYPIRSTLLLNGELAGNQDHNLQLVIVLDRSGEGELLAGVSSAR